MVSGSSRAVGMLGMAWSAPKRWASQAVRWICPLETPMVLARASSLPDQSQLGELDWPFTSPLRKSKANSRASNCFQIASSRPSACAIIKVLKVASSSMSKSSCSSSKRRDLQSCTNKALSCFMASAVKSSEPIKDCFPSRVMCAGSGSLPSASACSTSVATFISMNICNSERLARRNPGLVTSSA